MLKKTIIILVLVIISIGVLFWKNNNKQPPLPKNEEKSDINIILEMLPKQTPEVEKIFGYSLENANDNVKFSAGNITFEFKRVDSYETSLKVRLHNSVILSNNYNGSVFDVYKIKWKEKEIILVNYFSGGAHCCTTAIPYLVNKDNIVEGQSMFLGNTGSLNKGSFFIKNNNLYIVNEDDRFSYFEMDYATSSNTMRFPYFAELVIDPLEFVERNNLFSDIYKTLYKKSQLNAKKLVTKENCDGKKEFNTYEILGSLVYRYSLGYFSGISRENLKGELRTDWWCFPEKNFDTIENDIYQIISKGDASLISSKENEIIVAFVNKFENKIKERDISILSLFSEPQVLDDKKTLTSLNGDFDGIKRLFLIALFNYRLEKFKITDI